MAAERDDRRRLCGSEHAIVAGAVTGGQVLRRICLGILVEPLDVTFRRVADFETSPFTAPLFGF